jgi:hypothetical protein
MRIHSMGREECGKTGIQIGYGLEIFCKLP